MVTFVSKYDLWVECFEMQQEIHDEAIKNIVDSLDSQWKYETLKCKTFTFDLFQGWKINWKHEYNYDWDNPNWR